MSDGSLTQGSDYAELRRHWPILLTAFVGVMTGVYALPFYIVGPLSTAISADVGWDRATILSSTAFLAAGQMIGAPLFGQIITRIPARRVAIASAVLLTIMMAALAMFSTSAWMMNAAYFVMGFACSGCGPVVYTHLIGRWFDRNRGFALGVALSGTGVASFAAPLIVIGVEQELGWRATLLVISAIMAVGVATIALGFREPPQDAVKAAKPIERGQSWRAIAHQRRFQLLALIMGLTGFFIGGLVVHVVPMLIDQGMSPTRAAQIAAFNGIALIAGRMATGWLLDRYRATSIAMAIFFLAAVGCLTFAFGGVAWAVPMVLAMGIMIGSEIDLLSYLVLRYFDKDQAPAAFGALFGLFMGGSIASPWLINLLFTVGDYQAAFGTAAGVFSFTIFLFFLLSRLPMAAARPAAPSA